MQFATNLTPEAVKIHRIKRTFNWNNWQSWQRLCHGSEVHPTFLSVHIYTHKGRLRRDQKPKNTQLLYKISWWMDLFVWASRIGNSHANQEWQHQFGMTVFKQTDRSTWIERKKSRIISYRWVFTYCEIYIAEEEEEKEEKKEKKKEKRRETTFEM